MVYVMWLSTAATAAGPWAKMFSLLGIWHDIHVIAQNNNSDIVFNLFYFIFAFPLLYFHRDSVLDSINLGATRRLEVSSRSGFKKSVNTAAKKKPETVPASVGNSLALTVAAKEQSKRVSAWHMSFYIQMNSLSTWWCIFHGFQS